MFGHIEIIKNVYDAFSIYKSNYPLNERQVLDPLTTMIKLAILGYKSAGTKLAIDANRIYFQEPTVFQGFWRWAYGNKRYELHHLLNPILKAVRRYDVVNPSIKLIFENAVLGIDKLKSSYNNSSSVVNHSLDLYMSIINNVLIPDNNSNRVSSSNGIFHSVHEEEDTQHISIFQNLWTDDEINLVANMLTQIQNTKKDAKTYLDAVNTILVMKEDRANELINELTRRL
jgi:hypothetical protein